MNRLKIVHRTGFTYEIPATASYNEARMHPVSSNRQIVLSSNLSIQPAAVQHSYVDYWGTNVSTFEVLTPHTELSVTATSLVEVRAHDVVAPSTTWSELRNLKDSTTELVECSMQTVLTQPHKETTHMAEAIAKHHENPGAAALEIAAEVHKHIAYTKGATSVQTTASRSWEAKKGVCQDIAHITLGALRAVGIPARYVSGYILSKADAEIGETIEGESHAWVEWFAGAWHGFDPTNMLEIGERHVLVAHGRDYKDVAPLRGVYSGANASEIFVSVEVTRV